MGHPFRKEEPLHGNDIKEEDEEEDAKIPEVLYHPHRRNVAQTTATPGYSATITGTPAFGHQHRHHHHHPHQHQPPPHYQLVHHSDPNMEVETQNMQPFYQGPLPYQQRRSDDHEEFAFEDSPVGSFEGFDDRRMSSESGLPFSPFAQLPSDPIFSEYDDMHPTLPPSHPYSNYPMLQETSFRTAEEDTPDSSVGRPLTRRKSTGMEERDYDAEQEDKKPAAKKGKKDVPKKKASPAKGKSPLTKSSSRRSAAASRTVPTSTLRGSPVARAPTFSPRPNFKPSEAELLEERTDRAKKALRNWYERLNDLYEYKYQHGHTNVPQKYQPNPALGVWVNKQRMERKNYDTGDEKSSMTEDKIMRLTEAGFVWAKAKGQAAWDQKYQELQDYAQRHSDCNVPTKCRENRALGRWVSTQRSMYKHYKKGKALSIPTDEMIRRIYLLEQLGFVWSMLPQRSYSQSSESSSNNNPRSHSSNPSNDPE